MPKIRITERDYTTSSREFIASNTVYIAGLAYAAVEPTLCKSTSDLYAITNLQKTSNAYHLAEDLLDLGVKVLYEGCIASSNGPSNTSWTRLADKSLYDIRFIELGDFVGVQAQLQKATSCAAARGDCVALLDHTAVVDGSAESSVIYLLLTSKPDNFEPTRYYTLTETYSAVASAASVPTWVGNTYYNKVSDTKYVLTTDKPGDWETNYTAYYTCNRTYTAVTTAREWATNTFYVQLVQPSTTANVAAVRTYFSGLTNGQYAAAFTPWFRTVNSRYTGGASYAFLPASFGYLLAYAKSITTYSEWEAVAGSLRGAVDILDAPCALYSNAECEMLQGRAAAKEVELDDEDDNSGIAINPIAYKRPFGYVIWGNRTLINTVNGNVKISAYLNVRNLVTTVKKALYETANKYTFELNSDILYSRFKGEISPILDNMVTGRGLVGYRWQKEATSAKARLKAKLVIVPIEAVEDFDITIELTDTLVVSE